MRPSDLIDESTGPHLYRSGRRSHRPENLEVLDKAGIDQLELLDIDHVTTGPWIRNTLKADKAETAIMGLVAISIASCVRANRQRAKPPKPCSKACSSIRTAMTFRLWAVSSSTCV
jgi:hypothetical protein